MGLLTTATTSNKIITQGLTVSYSKPRIRGSWTWTNSANVITTETEAFEYHRYATIRYKYVGMDYDAACTIADQLRASYTRDYYISDWQITGNYAGTFRTIKGGKKILGSVTVVKTVGHLYEIDVDINEDDVKMSISGNESTTQLFANENLRRYDY